MSSSRGTRSVKGSPGPSTASLCLAACLNSRDRNLLGLRRDLLTAASYGVDQFLFVYGDKPALGSRTSELTVRAMMEEARALGASVSVAEAARRTLLDALADQGPAADITSVVKYLGKIAGIEFPQTRTAPVTR